MIMDIRELRIGNLIEYQDEILIVTSVSIDFVGAYSRGIGRIRFSDSQNFLFKPIPITEELLLKFGFEKNRSDEWSNYCSLENKDEDSLIIVFEKGEFYYSAGEGVELSKKYKYIHELQNLNFAILGVDLDIKFIRRNKM